MEDDFKRHIPLDIIEQIVSKVRTTEDAVKTSVLSKDCQSLWTNSRFIDVNIERVKNPNKEGFSKFVDGVLQKTTVDLDFFSLSCSDFISLEKIWSWIQTSLNKKVKALDLNFSVKEDELVRLPDCLGTSDSLEVLRLNLNSSRLMLSIATNHLKVRVLELNSVNFMGNGLAWALFWNSKLLEELVLVNCVLGGKRPEISCLSLKRLKWHNVGPRGTLMLDCPKLQMLEYQGEADIQCFDGNNKYSVSLPTVSTLVLTYTKVDQLVQFLRTTPVLESLHLVFHEELKCGKSLVDELNNTETLIKLNGCLKSVSFFDFDEDKNKMVAGFLLANGSSLHKMVFYHKRTGDTVSKVWNFAKASPSVKIIDIFH